MTITNSIFNDNYYRQVSSDLVGGGMLVYHDYQTHYQSYYINISSVVFDSNSANTVKVHKYSFEKIGGGLRLQLKNQTNMRLSVSDCTFLNNSAAPPFNTPSLIKQLRLDSVMTSLPPHSQPAETTLRAQ